MRPRSTSPARRRFRDIWASSRFLRRREFHFWISSSIRPRPTRIPQSWGGYGAPGCLTPAARGSAIWRRYSAVASSGDERAGKLRLLLWPAANPRVRKKLRLLQNRVRRRFLLVGRVAVLLQ